MNITILFQILRTTHYAPTDLPVGYCGLGLGLDFMSYGSFIHV